MTTAHNNIPVKELVMENSAEKDNLTAGNVKIQTKKHFNLETEISKLKIAIPLSELPRHEVFREQISRKLQF